MPRRAEGFGLLLTAAVVAAFVISFGRGLVRDRPAADPAPRVLNDVTPEPSPRPRGRIEVLNASRRRGIARMATDELRAAGFDVVFFGNAPASLGDSSVVIDRVGDDAVARAVAARLGINRVRTQKDSTLLLDATAVVGVDWR